MVRLADKAISERSAAQHADFALASAMSFAAARALQNLRAFVTGMKMAAPFIPAAI